jgi:cysteine desulfuration protein SufE
MSDTQPTTEQMPPSIEKILRRFATLTPDMTRQALVQYANKLPPLPQHLQGVDLEQYRVHECQTPVAIFPEVVDGKMYYHAEVPRESAAIRALLAMIFDAVNGQPPETVLAIPPDFVRQVMGKIGLSAREAGLTAMVERLKRRSGTQRRRERGRSASGRLLARKQGREVGAGLAPDPLSHFRTPALSHSSAGPPLARVRRGDSFIGPAEGAAPCRAWRHQENDS